MKIEVNRKQKNFTIPHMGEGVDFMDYEFTLLFTPLEGGLSIVMNKMKDVSKMEGYHQFENIDFNKFDGDEYILKLSFKYKNGFIFESYYTIKING